MASLADILTTQKNGVVGINGLITSLNTLSNNFGNPVLFYRGAAATSYTTLYTTPVGGVIYVKDITVCNSSGSPINFYISLVPQGGTASAANAIFYSNPLLAYNTIQWTGFQVLEAGSTIQAYASSTSCTFSISGGEA